MGSGLAIPHFSTALPPMTKPLRMELAGRLYHVASRGDRREKIHRDDESQQGSMLSMFHLTSIRRF